MSNGTDDGVGERGTHTGDGERVRVGIDVGGTFTDVVAIRDGAVHVEKTPSTPDAPDDGVIDGLERSARRAGYPIDRVTTLAHGTTVATNAVLERDWAETALVTTAGFRDALEIGRQARPDVYDFTAEKPAPVVPRDRRFEVEERLDERGRVETPLSDDDVRAVAGDLADAGVESVAVSLLFSFENPDHERRLAERLREEGVEASISLSSDVLPEIREYERTLATALNAALKPVMDRYVGRLDARADDLGVPADLRIMASSGGLIGAERARTAPVRTLLSGPAAGVQGAAHVAERAGVDDVITMDMGGTSCDVSVVRDGDPIVSSEVEVGAYPVRVPMVEIHTIGAGGGSIAWIDDGGALRVGPRSAGAEPGPICYGRGGTEPTVTDAHLLLGRLDPDSMLSGDLSADADAVANAVRDRIADPLGMGVEEAAEGILNVANANMERALRVVSVERGHDPRGFALVAFGGAGPLHAVGLAAELDVPRVLVPRAAGVLSALGLLVTDHVHELSTSMVRPLDGIDATTLAEAYADFEREGRERLAAEGISDDRMSFQRSADLRYVGQSFDLRVPVPADLDGDALDTVAERFHAHHERRYGHASSDEPVELAAVRLRAVGRVPSPDLRAVDPVGASDRIDDAIVEERPVVFDGRTHDARVYDRAQLPPAGSFDGPAIVEGEESTVVLPPETSATVDPYGTIDVEVGR